MKQEVFTSCLERWKNSDGFTKFWPELAEKWGYQSGESLRWAFKQERKKQGITKEIFKKEKNTFCKILIMDIETTPILGMVWGMYDQNLSYDRIIQDWYLLSWSAKWLFEPKVMSDVLVSEEAKLHDDRRITKSIWHLLDKADVVIAHNGNAFDLKKLNARFIKYGLNPPSHYQSIDTLLVARNVFRFTSNKLDDLCTFFEIPNKKETTFDLWKRCFYGEEDALKEMEKYNRNDSVILEDVYLRLRPWIKGHPNLNLWNEELVSICPNCGGDIKIGGNYYTSTGRYDSFKCFNCGAIGRSKKNNLSKDKNKTIIR